MQNLKLNNIFDFYHSSGLYDRVIFKKKIKKENNITINDVKKSLENLSYIFDKNKEHLVFSDGNFKSKIMIIGEAPGVSDEKENKPFVGEAGKLLDKMLSAINLTRNIVYITNVINFRPPDNRKPTIKEIEKFKPLLLQHISLIRPEVILLLGSTAYETFFGSDVSITKSRGQWLKINIDELNIDCIASFHPAFLLRQPQQKKYSWEDLKKLKEKIVEKNIISDYA
jgi:uracil-DNA glycosylase family 4